MVTCGSMETISKSVMGESGEADMVASVVVVVAVVDAVVVVVVVVVVVAAVDLASVLVVFGLLLTVGLVPPFSSFSHSIVNSAVKCLCLNNSIY